MSRRNVSFLTLFIIPSISICTSRLSAQKPPTADRHFPVVWSALKTAAEHADSEHSDVLHKRDPTGYRKSADGSFVDKTNQAGTHGSINPADYVGQDSCKACHEDMFKGWEMTPHWRTTLDPHKGPEWQGCEACHGSGKAHADAEGEAAGDPAKIEAANKLIFNFKSVPARDSSKRCLRCHIYGEEHSNFARQAHNLNDVSCIDCHSPHHARQKEFLLVARQPLLCYSCHNEVKADFSKTFHHRVNEGLIKCTDCHNEHGGFLTRQLRSTAAQDVICFKCHVDKAGPFVYEHAPVKTEGCVICHTPHGSTNPRLLKRSQVNLLCLECHTFTLDSGAPGIPSFHNQSAKYQACTLCHTMIHGSNFSSVFFR